MLIERFVSLDADTYLRNVIRSSAHPDRLLVITDDREIIWTARDHGAVVQSVAWLAVRFQPSGASRQTPRADRGPQHPRAIERINAEQRRRFGFIQGKGD